MGIARLLLLGLAALAGLSAGVQGPPGVSPTAGARGAAPAAGGSIHVKLVDGGEAGALAEALRQFPGTLSRPLFSRPATELAAEERRLEAKTGRDLPDRNLWFELTPADPADADAIVSSLNALPGVETAYAEPAPAPTPGPPPAPSLDPVDLEPQQGYLDPAPDGVDASFGWVVTGGAGAGVDVIDIEYGWNQTHEDLSKAAGALIPNGTPAVPDWPEIADDALYVRNHGTGVLGAIVADSNGLGVTGIAFGSGLGLVNAYNAEDGYDLADAIDVAHASLLAGDVLLIEQQMVGPSGACNQPSPFVPVEWVPAFFDAIELAAADGIVVVEAAGNGGCDLDDAAYGGAFDPSLRDSGAIIVGAASAPGCGTPARARLGYSTYGSRVDLQGWGVCVVTAGYGYLHGEGGSENHWYTSTFNGTSSAAAIVAGAAAALQAMHVWSNGFPLSPAELRSILVDTGTPQDTSVNPGHIGPLPDLAGAYASAAFGACGTDPENPNSAPERVDGAFAGADEDGDALVDEPLPPGAGLLDCDGDGFTGSEEAHVYGRAPGDLAPDQDPCGTNLGPSNPPSPSTGWPLDLHPGGAVLASVNRVTAQDYGSFLAPVRYLEQDVGDSPGNVRWDLVPGPGMLGTDINAQDLNALLAGASAFPPMLGGVERALDGPDCPWPP